MRHKKVIIIAAVAAVMVGSGLFWLSRGSSLSPLIIKGQVTETSSDCNFDGLCSVTIDGSKTIITGCGLMAEGKTCAGYDQSKLRVGQRVEATVTKGQGGMYELECSSCTIRVVGN